MKMEINKIDYYSGCGIGTFFSIANLQYKITNAVVDVNLLDAAVFWFTNVERRKFNLMEFQFHSKLRETAILHSKQMKTHNFFNHENTFDTRYKTLTDRINSVRNNTFQGCMSLGENIADYSVFKANEHFTIENRNGTQHLFSTNGQEIFPYTYHEFAKEVVDGWMNSSGHRANILNPNFVYLGCGCEKYEKQNNGYSMLYFKLTQNFGGYEAGNILPFDIKKGIEKLKEKIGFKKKIKVIKKNQSANNPRVLKIIKKV
jgi:uncharacterized protein YkwD